MENKVGEEARPPRVGRAPGPSVALGLWIRRKALWGGLLLAVVLAAWAGARIRNQWDRASASPGKIYCAPGKLTGGRAMATSVELAAALGAMGRHDHAAALRATEKLVAAFPDETDAHVLRGECLLLAGQAKRPHAFEPLIEAEIAAIRRIDPASPYPGFFTARLEHIWRSQWDGAADLFAPLLARTDLDPELRSCVLTYRALVDQHTPRGLALLEEACRLDPNNVLALRRMAPVLHALNLDAEALQKAKQALALDPCASTHFALVYGLCGLGRHDEAIAELRAAAALESSPMYTISIGMECLHAGRRAEARQVAESIGSPSVPEYAYGLACLWARLGERDRALGALRHAFALGYKGREFTAVDPDLEILHGNPEFQALLLARQPETPSGPAR